MEVLPAGRGAAVGRRDPGRGDERGRGAAAPRAGGRREVRGGEGGSA